MKLTTKEIMEIIPHRHPFLLIDTIEELVPGVKATGKKCVTYNEPHFAGHFPQEPVMIAWFPLTEISAPIFFI